MTRRKALRAVALGLAAALLIVACGGDSSEEIRIEGLVFEDGDGGTFTATGTLICAEGEYVNLIFDFTETLMTFEDEYACADGSGTFIMSVEIPFDPNVDEEPERLEGAWTVAGGTGDYADLQGSGTILSVFGSEWTETYTGEMSSR